MKAILILAFVAATANEEVVLFGRAQAIVPVTDNVVFLRIKTDDGPVAVLTKTKGPLSGALVLALVITGEHGGFGWPVIVRGKWAKVPERWNARPKRMLRPLELYGRPRP